MGRVPCPFQWLRRPAQASIKFIPASKRNRHSDNNVWTVRRQLATKGQPPRPLPHSGESITQKSGELPKPMGVRNSVSMTKKSRRGQFLFYVKILTELTLDYVPCL